MANNCSALSSLNGRYIGRFLFPYNWTLASVKSDGSGLCSPLAASTLALKTVQVKLLQTAPSTRFPPGWPQEAFECAMKFSAHIQYILVSEIQMASILFKSKMLVTIVKVSTLLFKV